MPLLQPLLARSSIHVVSLTFTPYNLLRVPCRCPGGNRIEAGGMSRDDTIRFKDKRSFGAAVQKALAKAEHKGDARAWDMASPGLFHECSAVR